MDLHELRRQLRRTDRAILDAWARRDAITAAIGRLKQTGGRPILDRTQEQRVIGRARVMAAERGLSEDRAARLMALLIESSLGRQEDIRVRAQGLGAGRPALVIGGGGLMGRWFCRFLDLQGYDVHAADPSGGPDGVPTTGDWRETQDAFALTVVAAPLGISCGILEEIARRKREGLIFDIGSVKAPLGPGLEALSDSGLRAASVHPLFGPDATVLRGCQVLVMEIGSEEAADEAEAVFAGTMARVLRIPLEEHDPLMAYVLGLSHALNLAFVQALSESGERARRLARLSSVTFNRQLEVTAAVAGENPHLYYEIQHANPHGGEALEHLAAAVTNLSRIVGEGDESAFVDLMSAGAAYLAERAHHTDSAPPDAD